MTVAVWSEIQSLHPKIGTSDTYAWDHSFLVNSPLVAFDSRGSLEPLLAAEVPSRDRGSWTLNSDGTMATTWKIRPSASWHDGNPLTARDFAFALEVYREPQIGSPSGEPQTYIERIQIDDERTFTIHWNRLFLRAERMIAGQLDPLPEHLLASTLRAGDPMAFINAPFWSSLSYVGNGPYTLKEWERGSHLVYHPYDRFFLGRAHIDEIVFQVIRDPNTVVAYLLSGTSDLTVDSTLNQEARRAVKEQWDRTAEGRILSTPTVMRIAQMQLSPSRMAQPGLADVRVRRALLHALNRLELAEAVSEGTSPVADTVIGPSDPLYPRAQQIIPKYAFDPARALALLAEAGWTRSTSGALASSSGQRFSLDIRTTQRADNEREMAIMSDHLKAIGIEVTQSPVTLAQNRDREFTTNYPSIKITSASIDVPWGLQDWASDECPTAENGLRGRNGGCWSNTQFDRLFRLATTTTLDSERTTSILEAVKLLAEEVPMIGTSYHMENVAVRSGLMGPEPRWHAQRGVTWNVHQWRWS